MKLESSVLVMMLYGASLFAQQGDVTLKSTEVAPGLYMIEGVGGFFGGNLGLSVGDDGVCLIDDGLANFSDKVIAAVAEITPKPVDFVVNTHVHGDHVGGNAALAKKGTHVVAHHNVRNRMLQADEKPARDQLPVVTFSEEMVFHLNGHEARVIHVAKAHTDGDAVIHFAEADVIHTGDVMFNGMFPFIDLDSGGSVDGYIAAQEKIWSMAKDSTKIIPGHGPLASKKDVEKCVNMLKDAKKKVAALVTKGHSADDIVAANPLADYESWSWQFITTERMIRTLVRDLSK